ncbi:ROK family transcriptional regulator [Actinoplanes regularis]|uniref:ROK family transcriptional regulator n=1 Tax=Actinoplanes regularis TaxID=52697 RepID=UPI0024A32332|nr:ROK family transcriptional regulator [Actinoplanes regularis]GLW30508.1 xylose repressor [Actinoplanes regularis]
MASLIRHSAREARWHTASRTLAWLRLHPGATRAALARDLGLTSGFATELTGRLRTLRLLAETPAPPQGRGRPTSVLGAHPEGPVVLAVDLRLTDWRYAVAGLDGRLRDSTGAEHGSLDPRTVLTAVRQVVDVVRDSYGNRLRAVALAIPGSIHDGRLAQSTTLGWHDVDLTELTAGTGIPLLPGNDATLAGLAEVRTGAAVGARAALHLMIEVGIGGAFTVDGCPSTGAHGAAGEYGHQPYGDRSRRCPCGARGCWDLEIGGQALARHLGAPTPADPHGYTRQILDRAGDPAVQPALETVAAALGAGIGALVNVHDPDKITLGGLAAPLRAAAPDSFTSAYTDGLMAFHRGQPPPVVDAAHGDNGALYGAAILALDHATSETALAEWATRQPVQNQATAGFVGRRPRVRP